MKNLLLGLCCLFLTLIFSLNTHAQTIIFGKVLDNENTPLIGVNVIEKGTTNGTISDVDGSYELTVKNPNCSLVYTYTGFINQEIKLDGREGIDVVLLEGVTLGEVQVVGSRSYNRSAVDSPVAVDVIDVADIAALTGKAELNQVMQYAAPSFNATKQSGSDGADHIDPASLRGLGPDQTLVLINGKRRHQSSLVNVFGTRGRGNSGTDLNAIPASAIKRIEVLRDGASAQYGSDAIAGVINIVLKDNEGLSGGITYGAHSTAVGEGFGESYGYPDDVFNVEGERRIDGEDKSFDGNTFRVDFNYGMDIGEKGGFANITGEYLNKERTLRPSFPWRLGYGSAAVDQISLMLNASMPLGKSTELYLFGGNTIRDTDAYAFSRGASGSDERTTSIYPDGFSPRITSDIGDLSASVGVRHTLTQGWKIDLNNTFGRNNFDYRIKGTNNASLGAASPTEFDAGGHSLRQNTTGLDLSKYYNDWLSGVNIAFGAEFRDENFKINAGEEGSYATYDVDGNTITDPTTQSPPTVVIDGEEVLRPGGSQGFPGYQPGNEVDEGRTNLGLYADAELNITDAFLVGTALRFENYSDFGSTFNYKLATRYKLAESFSVRGSYSSGFRAPSLAQIHYNLIFNNIVAGGSVRTLLASNTSEVARAFGIDELKEETAKNISLGFTAKVEGFTATIDAYRIDVTDRIILSDNFDASSLGVDADAAQFFANGVDTKTQGIDIVLTYNYYLNDGNNMINFGLAGNINDLEIEKIHNGDLNEFTFFGPFSRAYLEAAAPDYKFGLNAGFSTEKFSIQAGYTLFSEVQLQDFQWIDTPATTQAEADALLEVATDVYESAGTLDLSVSYNVIKNLRITIGGNNILNTYPTPQFDGWTDQGGFNDSVQMGSDGAYFFARLGFQF